MVKVPFAGSCPPSRCAAPVRRDQRQFDLVTPNDSFGHPHFGVPGEAQRNIRRQTQVIPPWAALLARQVDRPPSSSRVPGTTAGGVLDDPDQTSQVTRAPAGSFLPDAISGRPEFHPQPRSDI